jgi:hypothetical protein
VSLSLIGRFANDAAGRGFVLASVGVPAWAAVSATSQERSPFGSALEGRVAAFLLYFMSFLALGAALLARLDLLRPIAILVSGTVAIAVGSAFLWRRRRQATPVDRVDGHGVRRRERLIASAFLAGTVMLALPQLAVIAVRSDSVPWPTPWYFWQVTEQYERAHGIPSSSEEWGTTIKADADYPGFNAGSAAIAAFDDGDDSLLAAQFARALAVVGALLALFALARTWGASRLAAIGGAAILAALQYWAFKVSSYRPEAYGFVLMLLVPAFVTAYLATRRRSLLVAAAVGAAALSQIHGIAFIVAGTLVAGVLVADFVRRRTRQALAAVALVAALLAGAWIVTDVVVNGRVRQLSQTGTIPTPGPGQPDLTLEFHRQTLADPSAPLASSFGELVRETLEQGFAGDGRAPTLLYYAAICLAVAALLAALLLRRRRVAPLLVRALVATGLIVLICLAFNYGWSTYVPRRTGASRVLGAGLVLLPLVGSVAVVALGTGRLRRALVATWVSIGILAFALSVSTVWGVREWQPSRTSIEGLRSRELPRDSLVLTNAYSEGFVPTLLGRRGINDGRALYLDGERLLRRGTRILDDAHRFFARPAEEWRAFRDRGVTHVLVGTEPWMFSAPGRFPTDVNALLALPELRLVDHQPGFMLFSAR